MLSIIAETNSLHLQWPDPPTGVMYLVSCNQQGGTRVQCAPPCWFPPWSVCTTPRPPPVSLQRGVTRFLAVQTPRCGSGQLSHAISLEIATSSNLFFIEWFLSVLVWDPLSNELLILHLKVCLLVILHIDFVVVGVVRGRQIVIYIRFYGNPSTNCR